MDDELTGILGRIQAHLAAYPFDEAAYGMSREAFEKREQQAGEEMAARWIVLSKRKYRSPARQAKELRWWCGFCAAFPSAGLYAFPVIVDEIKALEQWDQSEAAMPGK